jgi:predicted metal-dependent peptidase
VSAVSLPLSLQAARFALLRRRPYLAAAVMALQPVARPGLGTLAVDEHWRLYYDPAVADAWSVDALAGVLYHEVCHLLRAHHDRLRSWDPRAANLAGDAEINDDLAGEGIRLPEGAIYPRTIGQPDHLLAEEYAQALQGRDSSQSGGAGRGGRDSHGGQRGAGASAGGHEGGERREASGAGGGDSAHDAAEEAAGSGGGGEESVQAAGGTQGSDEGSAQGAGSEGDAPSQAPAPGCGRCGSCATGRRAWWEDPAPGEPGAAPGTSRAGAEILRRQVAEAVRRHSRGSPPGTIPGQWARWADEILAPPAVDWRRELGALVRGALRHEMGAVDYTYARPSRRQPAVPDVALPSLRRPAPQVAVVVDTSGSIDDSLLARALSELQGILRAAGLEGARVLGVDTRVQGRARAVSARQARWALRGGGGTDMGAGIAAALRERPRPDVIVVLTDGLTPWPDRSPTGARVVVGLLGQGGTVPSWARSVRIPAEGDGP